LLPVCILATGSPRKSCRFEHCAGHRAVPAHFIAHRIMHSPILKPVAAKPKNPF